MRRTLLATLVLFVVLFQIYQFSMISAQILYSDNFEGGSNGWQMQNAAITNADYVNGRSILHCPDNTSSTCSSSNNHFFSLKQTGDTNLPLIYKTFSTVGYKNIKVSESWLTSRDWVNPTPVIAWVYRIGNSGNWNTFSSQDIETTYPNWIIGYADLVPNADNVSNLQIGYTYLSGGSCLFLGPCPTSGLFVDDFRLTGDPISSINNGSIACKTNLDCGSNSYGTFFCMNSTQIATNEIEPVCNYPNTTNSYCSNVSWLVGVGSGCPDYCMNGSCQTFTCHNNSECDDNNISTQDTCLNPNTLNSTCLHNPIICFRDLDCNDNNNLTLDQCINPGISASFCRHIPINCISNADCGLTGFIGQEFCSGNNTEKNFQNATCINPGNIESFCSISIQAKITNECNYKCSNGSCITCKDTDGDGVCDDSDICPSTPTGSEVNNNGCSKIQFCKSQPICGMGCDFANWKGNGSLNPHDCETIIVNNEGSYYPRCVAIDYTCKS